MPHWRTWEITYLSTHCNEGADAVATRLGRSKSSVQVMASRLGISLRPCWHCPRCGRITYMPLSTRTGWCRCCTVDAQRARAQEENDKVRAMIAEEKRRVEASERARQAAYSDNNRQRAKLRRIRES